MAAEAISGSESILARKKDQERRLFDFEAEYANIDIKVETEAEKNPWEMPVAPKRNNFLDDDNSEMPSEPRKPKPEIDDDSYGSQDGDKEYAQPAQNKLAALNEMLKQKQF